MAVTRMCSCQELWVSVLLQLQDVLECDCAAAVLKCSCS